MENSSLTALPKPYYQKDVELGLQKWRQSAEQCNNGVLTTWMQSVAMPEHPVYMLITSLFGNSPYLSHLLLLYPQTVFGVTTTGIDKAWKRLLKELSTPPRESPDPSELMRYLRVIKGKAALMIAIADITGEWQLPQVTEALSILAERSLMLAVDNILLAAQKSGEIELPNPDAPSKNSGIIILGMGKLGGHELNYSSDIDLIIFFEPGRLTYKGRLSEQKFMNRLCHDMVTIMQERTPHGYVFRTDLRLRPDPASTPPAISVDAAYNYYESVGQNWERAAMIKARPVAGDIEAGERFLKTLTPFMWRRNLDFAAISDIHSIKRQMDSKGKKHIQIKGHNIKLGQGGIREIEFFAQIHQLIWGGREPVLRTRATCETLVNLSENGLVDSEKEQLLQKAYVFLRTLEHRLQMVNDEQTHSLPENDDGTARIACFMGSDDVQSFERELTGLLKQVHDIYASSFTNKEEAVLGNEGNLVFTGVSHDPDTLETLRHMGFEHPDTVSEIIMGWHHGSSRATRTKRARELLTEMTPILLKRLSETANPDSAFLKFHEFLANLPSGVQLFSLFNANPHLLGLVADIMGSAPTLAENLSKNPELLDATLYDDFYAAIPSPGYLANQLDQMLAGVNEADTAIERIRLFRNEKQFQAGVQLLRGMMTAEAANRFLSHLADLAVQKTYAIVYGEFIKTYGTIEGSQFAVIALGKLGSQEMTFSSDIDLVFVYDIADFDTLSNGEKPLSPSVYYNRLAQRFVGALTAMGKGGRLYEVDTRLRPSGKEGLLAVSTKAITHYFSELAWTFEYMAFTKARIVIGSPEVTDKLDDFIHQQLVKSRDTAKLKHDANEMRERIAKQHAASSVWDIKYVRGGLVDIDFITQYLMLLHAQNTPGARCGSATDCIGWLTHSGRITPKTADALIAASQFLNTLFNMLRLCSNGKFDEATAPPGLKRLLVKAVDEKDFESLKARLIQVEQAVFEQYIAYLN